MTGTMIPLEDLTSGFIFCQLTHFTYVGVAILSFIVGIIFHICFKSIFKKIK